MVEVLFRGFPAISKLFDFGIMLLYNRILLSLENLVQ
jgi:hypothetical protein